MINTIFNSGIAGKEEIIQQSGMVTTPPWNIPQLPKPTAKKTVNTEGKRSAAAPRGRAGAELALLAYNEEDQNTQKER